MGLRGPGAKPVQQQDAKKSRKKRRPWDKPGLSRAERVIAFLQTLPISSGSLAGTKLKVRPWQRRIIEGIYRTDGKGHRIVREALLTIPRKNGKTGLTAGLALCHFLGPESESRGEIFSAAAKRKQAAKVFEEMKAIILRVPWMADRVNIRDFSKDMEDAVTGSKYWALAAEASTEHGGNTSCWIYDELAQAKNRQLYDVLKTSTGARKEPLGIVISTQSHDPNHIMSELVDYGTQIQEGTVNDPSFYAAIYTAPMNADPWSEETWFACNPALGDFRSIEEMRDFAAQARRRPALEATFRLLYLNQRVSDSAPFIPPPMWNACGSSFSRAELKGQTCFGAIDLSGSGKNDLTSLILVFDRGDEIRVLPFFWSAEGGLEEAEHRDRQPYRLWAKDGHILTTPGDVLDYGFIAQKLGELSLQYQIELLAIDPWHHPYLIAKLNDLGLDLVMQIHGQGIKDMSPAVTALENFVVSKRLRHPGNPVLTWCMGNVKIITDSSGNRKMDKRKATGRIDGAVALAMAANLAANFVPEPQGSYAVTVI